MAFTQNGRIKSTKTFAGLAEIGEDPKMEWTDDRVALFLSKADEVIKDNREAIHVATSCNEAAICNQLLSHFVKKFGIADLLELKGYLSALKNEQLMIGMLKKVISGVILSVDEGTDPPDVDELRKKFNHLKQAPLQTQTDIVTAAADLLVIPEGADLDQIGKIATISSDLISFSKEQMLLEESVVDAALPLLNSVFDLSQFINENVRTNSCTCALVAGFAQEKMDYFPNAKMLLGMVGGPTDMMPNEVADLVNSTRLAIYDVAAGLLSKNGNEASLSQLKRFAVEVRDHKGDGSGSQMIEDAVNAVALTKVNGSQEAAEMARAYKLRSGTNRFLLAYLNSLEKEPDQNDLDTIAGAVKSMNFNGVDVFTKLSQLAKQYDLEFDENEALAKMNVQDFPPMLEKILLSGILNPSAGGKMTFESLRKSRKGCQCPVCQIRELVEEDLENISLMAEWEETKEKLSEDGVLKKHTENEYVVQGGMDALEQAMERHEVSDTMRGIIRKAYENQGFGMTRESFREAMGPCTCVDCQIFRLVQENAEENSGLVAEWETAKENLQQAGALKVYGKRSYAVKGGMKNLEQAMEKCGISDKLRDILREAFSKDTISSMPLELATLATALGKGDFPGDITVEVVPKTNSADELREELEKQLQAGTLATFKAMTSRGFMTVKEMAEGDPKEVNPEMLKIIQEYAAKIE